MLGRPPTARGRHLLILDCFDWTDPGPPEAPTRLQVLTAHSRPDQGAPRCRPGLHFRATRLVARSLENFGHVQRAVVPAGAS